MKRFRILTAALCAVVLLCGFTVTAYAGGGEEYEETTGGYEEETEEPVESVDDTTVTENPFTTSGTGTVVDNATDGDGKEFFTITTADESVFYLIIDRQKSSENVYFLNAVTVSDLLALAESSGESIVSTTPTEPEPEPTETAEDDPAPVEEANTGGGAGVILLALAVVVIGGGAAFYFKVYRPKQQRAADAENDYGGEPDTYDDYDDEDDGPPWDEDEGDAEEEDE